MLINSLICSQLMRLSLNASISSVIVDNAANFCPVASLNASITTSARSIFERKGLSAIIVGQARLKRNEQVKR